MVKAINTLVVSLMRDSVGIGEWTKADLDVTDRKTRKLMTMYGMLHPMCRMCNAGLYFTLSVNAECMLRQSTKADTTS